MSSKSNARLPAEPLISIRMAFLRPSANRVASKVAERAAGEPAEEHRGVVDGDRARRPRPPAPPTGAGGSAGSGRSLTKVSSSAADPGQPLAGDVLGEVDDVRADVAERAGAGLVLLQPPRHRRGRVGDPVLQVLRPDVPDLAEPALGDQLPGERDRRHPAVGEADHRPHARAPRRGRRPRPSPRPRRRVLASGFSQSTCLPASSAAIAISAWVSPGVQMSTRSTSSRSTSAAPVGLGATPSRAARRPSATAVGVAAGEHGQLGAQRQVEEVRCGAPGLRVGGAHEGVADQADAEGGAVRGSS